MSGGGLFVLVVPGAIEGSRAVDDEVRATRADAPDNALHRPDVDDVLTTDALVAVHDQGQISWIRENLACLDDGEGDVEVVVHAEGSRRWYGEREDIVELSEERALLEVLGRVRVLLATVDERIVLRNSVSDRGTRVTRERTHPKPRLVPLVRCARCSQSGRNGVAVVNGNAGPALEERSPKDCLDVLERDVLPESRPDSAGQPDEQAAVPALDVGAREGDGTADGGVIVI
jgi:hypothetical protein